MTAFPMARMGGMIVALSLTAAAPAPAPRIFIASDSTAQDYKADRAPQAGWGTALRCWTTLPVENRAIGWDGKRKVAEDRLRTAGAPVAIRLVPEEKAIGTGFDAVGHVRVEVVDAKGVIVPDAAVPVTVAVAGGTLAAFDNGSVTDHTPFASPTRTTAAGRALAMVRGDGGSVRLTATAPGLRAAIVTIMSKP